MMRYEREAETHRVNTRVRVIGRPEIRVVSASYRVEIWDYYELSGLHGYLIRGDKLEIAPDEADL